MGKANEAAGRNKMMPKEEEEGEDPFALIEKGNALEAATNHWGSADMYSRASTSLSIRADNISSQLLPDDNVKNEERRKIISLYRAQSLKYLYKARHCFIEAVKFENDQDRNRMMQVATSGKGRLDPLCSMLSSEESERRRCIFQALFSGQDDVNVKEEYDNEDEEDKRKEFSNEADEAGIPAQNDIHECTIAPAEDEDIANLQESMEARLANLNSSLANNDIPKAPPPFISGSRSGGVSSDQSRLDSLQRGLKGLGITLPDNSRNRDFIPDNLSDEDQVKLIMQQARDEVMIDKSYVCDDEDGIDENDSMFEGFEDEEDDIDVLLARAENLVAKTSSEISGIVDHPTALCPSSTVELARIRKAQALLLEARLCLEIGDAKYLNECANHESNDESASCGGIGNLDDNNNDGNEEQEDNEKSDRSKAKERVKEANECLEDILSGWRK
mmetsp:Transcript_24376/g.34917  ORF Transcript_24376/g.34917 Transcript_24376/m.34917 type:complete len:446 (-) Transcript_24376:454-1791(-)